MSARTGPERAPYRKPDAVRADLLAAATSLLADRLPRDVTVRDIAARAGMQHSMITRHFGSKDALIVAAVARIADGYAEAVTAAGDPVAGYVAAVRYVQALPAGVLALAVPQADRTDGDPLERFPGYAAHLGQLLDAGAPDDLRTRALAGVLLATAAGWSFVDDMVLDAAALRATAKPALDAAAVALVEAMVATVVPGAAVAAGVAQTNSARLSSASATRASASGRKRKPAATASSAAERKASR